MSGDAIPAQSESGAGQLLAPATKRRRPKDRKQQILLCARDLFVAHGYHDVSMAMIAAGVAITPGALYRHFANKSDLLEAVVLDSFSEIGDVAGQTLQEAVDSASVLAVARPHVGVLWAREARYLPEETRVEVRRRIRRSTQGYQPLIRADRPDLKPHQSELLAWGIQSVLASPSRHSIRVSAAEHAAAIKASALALAAADLAPDDGPAGRRSAGTTTGRSPLSMRERLLVAALDLFAQQGYQDTSMADIGARAEVTGPNLYGYFASKEELLRAAIDRGTHALWIDLDDALAIHESAADALTAVVAGYVRAARRWAGLRVDLTGAPDVVAWARARQREYVAEWVGLLRNARPELDQTVARLLVQHALAVIDDLGRTPHLVKQSSFTANTTSAALAVLGAAPTS